MKLKESLFTRRKFLNWSLTASLAALFGTAVGPVWRFVFPGEVGPEPTEVELKDFPELLPGTGKLFKFGRHPAIMIRTPDGKLKSFTAVCTHFECTVQYKKDTNQIWCACHNGFYDTNGKVVSGPPPRPLEEYDVAVEKDKIIVSRRGVPKGEKPKEKA
ncbi:MAG: hypothetical protein A3F87_04035 [Omnitrophica WOR_2 bacterium RIFCSPLOWO2_12_FULL_51_24]|nr:MAG: hypothetical protein A3F87_04035 [Omnitrophica WOR_2 bacterium RIFCSPLOWO2_12_FULL_51_24]